MATKGQKQVETNINDVLAAIWSWANPRVCMVYKVKQCIIYY